TPSWWICRASTPRSAASWIHRPEPTRRAARGIAHRSSSVCGGPGSWQAELEAGALARLGFRPDAPAMPRDDAMRDREPHAGAGKVIHAVQALEHAEQLVGVAGIEPDTIVLDAVDDLGALDAPADAHRRLRLARAELQRIA